MRVSARLVPATEPVKYLPGTNAEAYLRHQACKLVNGTLTKAAATDIPTHVTLAAVAAATPANTRIPVIEVTHDMEFETRSTAAIPVTDVGAKVTLHTDGVQVTGTKVSGVFTITYTSNAIGGLVRGMFSR